MCEHRNCSCREQSHFAIAYTYQNGKQNVIAVGYFCEVFDWACEYALNTYGMDLTDEEMEGKFEVSGISEENLVQWTVSKTLEYISEDKLDKVFKDRIVEMLYNGGDVMVLQE